MPCFCQVNICPPLLSANKSQDLAVVEILCNVLTMDELESTTCQFLFVLQIVVDLSGGQECCSFVSVWFLPARAVFLGVFDMNR